MEIFLGREFLSAVVQPLLCKSWLPHHQPMCQRAMGRNGIRRRCRVCVQRAIANYGNPSNKEREA
jgi:hypothetical protein